MNRIILILLLLLPCGLQAQDFIEWVENAFVPPTLVLNSLNQGSNYCTLVGNATISDEGSHSTSERGFVASTNSNPTINNIKESDGSGAGTFQDVVSVSDYLTKYYIRAYSINNGIVTYSNQLVITTIDKFDLTVTLTEVTGTTADIFADITENGNGINFEKLIWREVNEYGGTWNYVSAPTPYGDYTWHLTNLSRNATIEYFVSVSASTCQNIRTSTRSFTTPDYPTVSTNSTQVFDETTATIPGYVEDDGGGTISDRGFYWGTDPDPDSGDNVISDVGSQFVASLTGLTPNTTYYYKAWATNEAGTGYGGVKSFTTLEEQGCTPLLLQTLLLGSPDDNSIQITTNVNDDNNCDEAITSRYIFWNTTGNINDELGTLNQNLNYSEQFANINMPVGTYYFGFYAQVATGQSIRVVHSTALVFEATPPTLTTADITDISSDSATGGGEVTNNGGEDPTVRGVCYSTSPNPTIANDTTMSGTGTGSFTSALNNLTENTQYYVRAYATNSAGTGYGPEVAFTTLSAIIPPTVTTASITDIFASSATGRGNVTDNGGANVTARGVCYSTSPNPTIASDTTLNGIGTGSYTSSLNNLTENTQYYVRAYATNSAGTGYGAQKTFNTLQLTVIEFGGGSGNHISVSGSENQPLTSSYWEALVYGNLNPSNYLSGTSLTLGYAGFHNDEIFPPYTQMWRSYLKFETQSIPDNAIIEEVTLSLYAKVYKPLGQGVTSSISIIAVPINTFNTINAWQDVQTSDKVGHLNVSSNSFNTYEIDIETDALNKTGSTWLCPMFNFWDYGYKQSYGVPTELYSAQFDVTKTSANRPKLVVKYYTE